MTPETTDVSMDSAAVLHATADHIMHTYSRQPVAFIKGRGTRLWSLEGKEYLDFMAGIAVNALGHCHPKVVVAIQKQAQRLLHVSNIYFTVPQAELAQLLVKHSFADRVFFCNSGTEAVEAAIKLARKYSKDAHGPDRFEIVAAQNSFHGRTMASLSATGQEKYRKGFGPMLQGFKFAPYNDIDALQSAIGSHTCAVILEPIQGEGGIHVPDKDYLARVRELCDKKKILLILDEIQTGMGRTGKLFAYEHSGITPDIMSLAKGLGGGVAIGCMLATSEVASAFTPGTHASTFGGNPLACAAAVATVEQILEDGILLNHVTRMGNYMKERLETLQTQFPRHIKPGVRGMGLLLGLELAVECPKAVKAALEAGLLLVCAGDNVLRFCPPLVVTVDDIDEMIQRLSTALASLPIDG